MLSKERVVLDRVAKTTNLFSQVIGTVVHDVENLCDITIQLLVVVELDRARVYVGILPLPGMLLGLNCLVMT